MSKEKRPDRMRRHPARAARGTTGDQSQAVLTDGELHQSTRDGTGSTARILLQAEMLGIFATFLLSLGLIKWHQLTPLEQELVRALWRET